MTRIRRVSANRNHRIRAQHGTLTPNGDGTFTYVPAANYSGADSFTYQDNDGQFNSNIATVAINITQLGPPPIAVNDFIDTFTGQSATINRWPMTVIQTATR